MRTMATNRVHRWLDYITNERPSHRTSVLVSIIQDVTQRLQLADDQIAYLLTPFVLAAWDLRMTAPQGSEASTVLVTTVDRQP